MSRTNENSLSSMKVVIFAGGFGTRISEESRFKPKPMINIGEKPILWHIMKVYSHFGFNDFIICLGYKSHDIKTFFANYYLNSSDVTFDFNNNNQLIFHKSSVEPWKVTLVDTGSETMTGGRLKRIKEYVNNSPFMLTYGDGVADINIKELAEFHFANKKIATVTATMPAGRFGSLQLAEDQMVTSFQEKPKGDKRWVNAGFFVMQPEVFDYIEGDTTILEKAPLENLSKDHQLIAYKHNGFWQSMDTMRDKQYLEELWKLNQAPWKVW